MKTPEFILLRQHLRRGGYLNAIYLINQSFKSPTLYTLYHRHHRHPIYLKSAGINIITIAHVAQIDPFPELR